MSSDKKNTSQNEQNKAGEPKTTYGKKRITFFDSFESMNEHDHHYYASLTPEERLQTVLEMRNTVWPDERTSNPFGCHIYFKK